MNVKQLYQDLKLLLEQNPEAGDLPLYVEDVRGNFHLVQQSYHCGVKPVNYEYSEVGGDYEELLERHEGMATIDAVIL